jgi:isoquinoline 1-oxidoreductase beta subunit
MKIAVIARPPVFAATVRGFDDKSARSIAGVRGIFEIPLVKGSAVAVIADRFWAAKQARELAKIDWNTSGIERADSAELRNQYRALARTTGKVALSRGGDQALSRIPEANRIVAEYDFSLLGACPMQPLNVTLRYDGDSAEAWVSSQFPSLEQAAK